jgi:23S rRNA (cytosine1962-C5)-methyltransferase
MDHQLTHSQPPCVLFEDEQLLVVNKPPGWNTHSPSPYAGEGIYDWLKHREPRWANLAIIHRLDKETSGVMVFGKTKLANRSLTDQFAGRAVRKTYLLLADQKPRQTEFTARSRIVRMGERYGSGQQGEEAETRFSIRGPSSEIPGAILIEAEPLTGRTHQIRVHAAEHGFPIRGDVLYGGQSFKRLCLHASVLELDHPDSGLHLRFAIEPQFDRPWSELLREAFLDRKETNAFRLLHAASEGRHGCYLDALGDYALVQQNQPGLTLQESIEGYRGAYLKLLTRHVRASKTVEASPELAKGQPAPDRFSIRENGVGFELSFKEGYSVGLFLDQRDNRRRLLVNHVAADFPLFPEGATGRELLNVFAYTCGFSVCAALGGARTTSLDLSKKYLEWGKRNFALNQLEPTQHDFIYGDAFDWLKRLAKKGRQFDVVLLDPPTFSQSKEHGIFRAEKDYGKLVVAALPILKAGGVLFASTNAAGWDPAKFLANIEGVVQAARRTIRQRHYVPQPPDFPISRAEPAYLKTVWLRLGPQ